MLLTPPGQNHGDRAQDDTCGASRSGNGVAPDHPQVRAAVRALTRGLSEVAGEFGVAWWTVHRILVATAVQVLGQVALTTMIGIDETRARSVRWFFKESGWARSDAWMTSIVDLDPTHPTGIIGLAPGRSGACVEAWLALQTKEFRDGVTVAAIDPVSSVRVRDPPGATTSGPRPWPG